MSPTLTAYGFLGLAIFSEICGSTLLQKSEQFTKIVPTVFMVLCFSAAFFFLSHALKVIPLGMAYAIWSGVGIVVTAIVGLVLFKQALDAPAVIGMALIVAGVCIMNLFSRSTAH